jgi:hypothetical protein
MVVLVQMAVVFVLLHLTVKVCSNAVEHIASTFSFHLNYIVILKTEPTNYSEMPQHTFTTHCKNSTKTIT